MEYEYIIQTSIDRNFDPEVEGETLDSIFESCGGYVSHSVPWLPGKTSINLTLSRPLEEGYVRGQLNDNFAEDERDNVVLSIQKS